jgi:hypothetical protein
MTHDLALLGALATALFVLPRGAFSTALAAAILLVLAWGFATLHFPRRIEIDSEGVTFAAYGRAHRFLWRDVKRVRVRRFLMRDRVLVRIEPSPPWRGRYWITEKIAGFDDLVRELEKRG